jgi:hypothetical protein
MLYIERNADGKIAAIHQTPTDKATEKKTMLDEEIIAFLGKDGELDSWIQLLSVSDVSIIRVIEDLIDVLVKKNIIMLTDLPEEARDKLKERKRVRKKLETESLIVNNII